MTEICKSKKNQTQLCFLNISPSETAETEKLQSHPEFHTSSTHLLLFQAHILPITVPLSPSGTV